MVYIIKKDGTKEEFDAQKIVRAVNKSAQRILYTFSQQEIDFICKFATEHVYSLGKTEIPISDMHTRKSKPGCGKKLPRLPQLQN